MFYHNDSGLPVAFMVDFSGGWANSAPLRAEFVNREFHLNLAPEQCHRSYIREHHPAILEDFMAFGDKLKRSAAFYRDLRPRVGALAGARFLKQHVVPYTTTSGATQESVGFIHDWLKYHGLTSPLFHLGVFCLRDRAARTLEADYSAKAEMFANHDEIGGVIDDELKKLEPIHTVNVAQDRRALLYHIPTDAGDIGQSYGISLVRHGWPQYAGLSLADRVVIDLANDPNLSQRRTDINAIRRALNAA